MPESALTPVDERVEKALQLRAQGKSWRACARALGCDHRGLMRAVEVRCPEALNPQLTPETRRVYFTERNAELLDEAGRQLEEALAKGEISGKALPTTYGILADKQQRFEGWGREAGDRASFADTMAAAMMKAGGGKVMVSVEVETVNEDGEVIDVTPVTPDES